MKTGPFYQPHVEASVVVRQSLGSRPHVQDGSGPALGVTFPIDGLEVVGVGARPAHIKLE